MQPVRRAFGVRAGPSRDTLSTMATSERRPAFPAAFYRALGAAEDGAQRFAPTDYTRSVWDSGMQHGSPPAALLVRAVQRGHPRGDVRIARATIDLLGPVPVTECRVRTRVLRPGRTVELVRAELEARREDGTYRTAVTASVWRMATEDTGVAERVADPSLSVREPAPESGFGYFGRFETATFIDAVDWEWLTVPAAGRPGRVWARSIVPLVHGESPGPIERMFSVIDAANGVAATLDPAQWTFLNTEMTVHIHRVPTGEDVGIAAEASIGPDGLGMCSAVIHDAHGPVARTAQALLVRERP